MAGGRMMGVREKEKRTFVLAYLDFVVRLAQVVPVLHTHQVPSNAPRHTQRRLDPLHLLHNQRIIGFPSLGQLLLELLEVRLQRL